MDDKNCIYSAVLEEGTCGGPRGKLFAVQSFEKEETARIKTILNAKGVKFVSFPSSRTSCLTISLVSVTLQDTNICIPF